MQIYVKYANYAIVCIKGKYMHKYAIMCKI